MCGYGSVNTPSARRYPWWQRWRELRNRDIRDLNRVEWAVARVRPWELEAARLGEFHLTLPPEIFPLDDERRRNHLRQWRDALAEVLRELRRAKRARWLWGHSPWACGGNALNPGAGLLSLERDS